MINSLLRLLPSGFLPGYFGFTWVPLAFCLTANAADPVVFEDLKPTFKKHCNTCHNSERPRGGLDLSTKSSILAGSDSGQTVFAGKPSDSLLYKLSAHLEAPHMPPNSPKMPDRDLEKIKTWIALGLPERKDIKNGQPALEKAAEFPAAESGKMAAATLDSKAIKPENSPSQNTTTIRLPAVTGLAFSATRGWIRPLAGSVGESATASLPFQEKEISSLRTYEDGNWILAAGGQGAQSGRVTLWNHKSETPVFEQADENDTVLAAEFLPDSGLIALGGPSRVIKVISTTEKKLLYTVKKHVDWILDVRFSPDGLLLASSDRSGTVMVSEAATGAEVLVLRGHNGPVPAVAWTPDSNRIATAGQDGKLILWDAHWGKQIASATPAEGKGLTALVATRDGRFITSGRDKQIRLWSGKLDKTQIIATAESTPISLGVRRDLKEWAMGTLAGQVFVLGTATFNIPEEVITNTPLPVAKSTNTPPELPPSRNTSGIPAPAQPQAMRVPSVAPGETFPGLGKMREILRELEQTCELLKDQAARNPTNKELTEGYLNMCRTILNLKSEIIRLEPGSQLPESNPRPLPTPILPTPMQEQPRP